MVTKLEDRVKIDLVALSKLILDHLKQCDSSSLPHNDELLKRIAVQFNQGALLLYQFGEIEKAEILCRGSVELFAELSSYSTHRAVCLSNMIAPYLNLARIYGQKGEVKESLSIFEDIYRFGLQQQDLYIFGHRIPVADGPAMIAVTEPTFSKVLLSCRVIEAARVLQTVEDYAALLALVDRNADLPEFQDPFFRQYLLEVRSRALLHLGHYEMAMEALEECCRLMPATNTDRIVAHLLLSQIYRQWGRVDLAGETLNKLENHLAPVEQFVRRLPILRQVAYRLALERHAMGDNARAIVPAEKAFKWCTELNDQPGCIKAAVLLLRISRDNAEQRHWYEELRKLASTSLFRLERACAYWELGASAELLEVSAQESCEFLENSYELYRSIPFVDSRRSAGTVKRLVDALMEKTGGHGGPPLQLLPSGGQSSASIDSTFDALMEYAPSALSVC